MDNGADGQLFGGGAPTEQLAYVYDPDNVPLEQARTWLVQDVPYGTAETWYAVTFCP